MNIQEYLRLSNDKATLLHSASEGDCVFQVHEHNDCRWVFTGGASILSMMSLSAPAEPMLPCNMAMLAALLFSTPPESVLNLGFGAGSYERFFFDRLHGTVIVSVDTSLPLANIARTYFQIGRDWPVIIQTADDYLDTNSRTFDLVLCDIFSNDQHPHCLLTTNFYAKTARSLNPGGVMALNLSPVDEQELLEILVAIRHSFASVLLIKLADYGNLVLLAMQHRPPAREDMSIPLQNCIDQYQLDFSHILASLTVLPDRQTNHGRSSRGMKT